MANSRNMDFVLYASDETRKAIKLVRLFFSLMNVVGREMGHEMINLGSERLESHFPEFVDNLSLLGCSDNERAYCRNNAVADYNKAYNDGHEVLASMFYLHQPIDENEHEQHIMHKAKEIGILGSYSHLKQAARAALEKMIA